MQARKKKGTSFHEASVQYSLTYREVVDILQIMKVADHCESVELSIGDLKLKFRRSNGQATIAPDHAAVGAAPPEAQAPLTKEDARSEVRRDQSANRGGVVSAPMLGTFYRAPEPGAKPFVDVGSVVAKGDTVGLIEVMKLFSPVSADVAGEVAEILAENGALVEYGQPLIRVEPTTA